MVSGDGFKRRQISYTVDIVKYPQIILQDRKIKEKGNPEKKTCFSLEREKEHAKWEHWLPQHSPSENQGNHGNGLGQAFWLERFKFQNCGLDLHRVP